MTNSIIVEQLNAAETSAKAQYTTKQADMSFNDFIYSYPRGAYTGMRTVHRGSIVELDAHMKRIVNSVSLMKFAGPGKDHESDQVAHAMESFRDRDAFEAKLVPLLRHALGAYYKAMPDVQEAKVSIMVTYDHEAHHPRFATHVTELHQPPTSRVKVQLENKARTMPSVKDSQWVRDRAILEKNKPADVNEIVLVDDQGHVYEGMASNFFAVRRRTPLPETSSDNNASSGSPPITDCVLQCASLEHVLLGTVMKIIMGICGRDKIDIEWVFPSIQDARAGKWEGCFLSSTSRLLLPIQTIYTNDGSDPIEFPPSDAVQQLQQKVAQEIIHRSYRILDN
ncbi:aminotransferase [Gongronella butleri]|nr:aminotransferase [Gongronella butleri]